jgi:hypothetical protein
MDHHRRPDVSWLHLPRLTRRNDERPGYVRQYWRQWLGPQPATEPAPEVVTDLPLSTHFPAANDGPPATHAAHH